jgi:oligopeptide/dipeptide ABC transporter ATP-binding protein
MNTMTTSTKQAPILSIRGLSTHFSTPGGLLKAVQNVSLDVMPGECVGIVGESGSGKSVSFASVMGLIKPPGHIAAGEIFFDGTDLRQLSPEAMRRIRGKHIAMTMQDALTALNPAMTIEQQLLEVILAHDDDIAKQSYWQKKRQARVRAIEVLALVGIPSAQTRLKDYPHQFSGGMRQRIMIAIALACKPRLLITDEPTTALDVTIQAQVLELIASLRRKLGMSIVLITHDLGVVAEQCGRVVVMYAGQVVESGLTAQVIGAPKHPYTRGLLQATPRVEDLSAPVRPIPGTAPNLINFPAQCHFYSRCSQRSDACLTAIGLRRLADGQEVRCIQIEES